jgi:hypothetical protein
MPLNVNVPPLDSSVVVLTQALQKPGCTAKLRHSIEQKIPNGSLTPLRTREPQFAHSSNIEPFLCTLTTRITRRASCARVHRRSYVLLSFENRSRHLPSLKRGSEKGQACNVQFKASPACELASLRVINCKSQA